MSKIEKVNETEKKSFVQRAKSWRNKVMASAMCTYAALQIMPMSVSAFGENVTINNTAPDATNLMGQIIGILLTITRFVGVALVVYGVYEIVMSFMQNQPEAKTKGIIMALAGVVMIALKSVLSGLGVIA